jgi:sulfite exporter TauE/SafE
MAVFGLGTLPAMWAISFLGASLGQGFRLQFQKILPAIMALMAVLLILRGLNLDIPYVSPALHLSHSLPLFAMIKVIFIDDCHYCYRMA